MRLNFPQHYSLFRMKSYTYKGSRYGSHNKLLRSYPGMEGMKTGYISASGFNLVAIASRNRQRVITVVLGGRTSKSRDKQVAKLMDLGFSRVPVKIIEAPLPRKLRTKATLAKAESETTQLAEARPEPTPAKTSLSSIAMPKVLPHPAQKKAQQTPEKPAVATQKQSRQLNFTIVASDEATTPQTKSAAKPTAEPIPLQFTIIK
jgi:D-alanyl-D-alanine carboxypeptidase